LKSYRLGLLILALAAGVACREGEGVRVRSLAFEGVTAVDESELRLALVTVPSGKLPWSQKTYFRRSDFDEDLARIEQFYVSHGFPDARVTSFNAHYNDDKTAIDLTVRIDEGAPLLVERIEYAGFNVLPDEHARELRARTYLEIGKPRDQQQAQVARNAALDELRDHGYPSATVEMSERPGTEPRKLIVNFTAVPGPYATFGDVKVSGNSSVELDVIRRRLSFKPGDEFRLSRVRQSQRQLYALELFRFVNVDTGDVVSTGASATVPVEITVVEAPHRQATFGFGYGSEDHARVNANFTHVNFLGGARVASAEGKFSSLERGVRLSFTEPALSRGFSLGTNAQSWYSDTPAYDLRTTGGRIGLLKSFSAGNVVAGTPARASASLSFSREYESYTVSPDALADQDFRPTLISLGLNPETGRGQGTVSAIALDLQRNTVANLLDARHGTLVNVHAELAGKIAGGDYDYREVSAEGRGYIPLNTSIVLAAHVRASSIGAGGDPATAVPFFKRYFLGGSTSLRGWGRFEVSPLTSAGLPIGGFSLIESSGEVRWSPGGGALGIVGFVDAGNVGNRSWRLPLNDLLVDAGIGLRYQTLVGPLRVDVAYQLNQLDGLVVKGIGAGEYRRFRIHFSIGQAF
jgi:outer membrane protein assembly complex protein YaeT